VLGCECWFLDVGQGSSNIILLGEHRAIVIDCGPQGSAQTLKLLRQYVDTIELFVISHNDSDHDGNVQRILTAFRRSIRRILFLQDRTPGKIKLVRTIALLNADGGRSLPRPERLEADGSTPKVLFEEGDVSLCVLYPDFLENLAAQAGAERTANRTSGILRLQCGTRKLVFAGDATATAWESLVSKIQGPKPLACDIMAVPHHGGAISSSSATEKSFQKRLYSELIRPGHAVVSVGSTNRYNHPLPESIAALTQAGVHVLCTQMTTRCCSDLESVRGLRKPISPSRSRLNVIRTSGGSSRHVACFGSIVAEVAKNQVQISNITRYKQDVRDFSGATGLDPMCQPLRPGV